MLLRKAPLAAGRCRLLHLKQRNGTATSGFATSQRPQQQQKQQVNPQSQHVTAPVFAGLLKKSGLSQKKLHALYAGEGSSAPDGEFPIAVALSGGADSMALTLLLREYLQQQRIRTPLLAITVDHRLRVESTEEAQEIGRIVKDRWDIEHVIAQCAWAADEGGGGRHASNQLLPPKPRGSKLQEEARRYRYALLQQICREKRVRCLFVAHNLGDQLETVLFRLGRASGINGLAGIASVSPLFAEDDTTAAASEEVTLMRPLLSISKPQLKETCKRFKQQWVEDPSNEKLQFDRIRIRKVRAPYSFDSQRTSSVIVVFVTHNVCRNSSVLKQSVVPRCSSFSQVSSKMQRKRRKSLLEQVR